MDTLITVFAYLVGVAIVMFVAHKRRCDGWVFAATLIVWPIGLILALLFPGDKPPEIPIEEKYRDISQRLKID